MSPHSMPPLFLGLATAALLAGTLAGARAADTLLLLDTFDAATPNTFDVNVDLTRQTGTLAPLNYSLAFGPGHYGHQLQNANAQNQLLLADFPNSTSSLNYNFNGANSAGGLRISFDLDSVPTVYGGDPGNWGCINLGMSAADQLANVNQGVPHFGILFRATGTIQAFDGSAVVSPSPEPTYTTNPAGTTNHIELLITDTDGNPFDGLGNTHIEVYVNGGTLPVWSYTKVGGYADNYINLQGSFRAHFDNLRIERLDENRAPVVANASFEADNFTVFPGYVSGNGPITGWASLPNHGVNPGTFGGPFTDNGTIPDGNKAAFLQGDGALSQVVSGFTVGATYQVRYFENARNCCSGTAPFVEVTVGGVSVVAAHAVPPVGGSNPYRQVSSAPFIATSSSLQLAFIKSNPQGGDTTALIDDVSVVRLNTPPSISQDPQSLTIGLGDTASFTVVAVGTLPFTYRWYFGDQELVGETGPTLSFTASSASQAGDYRVIVSNFTGSVTSAVARLTLRAKVPGLFDTGVDDSGNALPDGAVDPHYTLVVNADGPSTEALVQNSAAFPIVSGPWLANTARSKWIGPRFDTSGAAGLAQGNGTYVYRTSFDLTGLDRSTVTITGGWAVDNLGVAIRVNGVPTGLVNNNGFSGATAFTLNSANASFVDGVNTLEFEVQNVDAVAGYTGLRVVNLRGLAALPGTPVAIESQPTGGTIGTGDNFTLAVVASGSSPLSYQWTKDGHDLPGANGPTYVITGATLNDSGTYAVRVSNPINTVTSSDAVLVVRTRVPNVFNTGVDASGAALADGETDTHYELLVNPDGTGAAPVVENSGAFPIVAGPWVANNAGSKWIGPRFDTAGSAQGDYTYRLLVDLTGFDPATVVISGVWATDNAGLDILVNGTSTGQANNTQFTGFTPFQINAGLLAGLNAVDFKLNNSAVGYTGLRVDQLRALGDELPAGTRPFIVEQPQSINRVISETARFFVRANGSGPVSYQWYFGPDPLPGETGPVLSFLVEFPDQEGAYSVEVSNAFGSVRSDPASLVVGLLPRITLQPQDQYAAIGESVTFRVAAIGEEPISYQWLRDGTELPGQTASELTLVNITEADAGVYSVRVSNFNGDVLSDEATLTVAHPLPGLYNTGVDDAGVSLPSGSVDPHWTLVQSADPAFPGPDAFVLNDVGFPIPPWLANDEFSKWIAPRADQSSGNLLGDYAYRLTFDLSGFDPASVRITGEWATDNEGTDILINGISTGQRNGGQFVTWTPFSISSGFQAGLNTLELRLNNAPSGVNPTGVRVRNLRGVAVPRPGGPPAARIVTVEFCSGAPTNVIISPNGIDALVVLDGSLSSDPDGQPLSFAWLADLDGDSTAETLGGGVRLTNVFELGEYEVGLVADDGSATSSALATLEIITACEAVETVILKVGEAPVTRKCKRPLVSTLKAACASFEMGDYFSGVNQLRAFSLKVRTEMLGQDPVAALDAMRCTQAIINALTCEE
ncbi:MAG TPA: immunoglobulin domain-containing protein [Methylomirabilota bacterium]|nr:immunoglobulin domain-containing protein [Methylomirabilota bacterium]